MKFDEVLVACRSALTEQNERSIGLVIRAHSAPKIGQRLFFGIRRYNQRLRRWTGMPAPKRFPICVDGGAKQRPAHDRVGHFGPDVPAFVQSDDIRVADAQPIRHPTLRRNRLAEPLFEVASVVDANVLPVAFLRFFTCPGGLTSPVARRHKDQRGSLALFARHSETCGVVASGRAERRQASGRIGEHRQDALSRGGEPVALLQGLLAKRVVGERAQQLVDGIDEALGAPSKRLANSADWSAAGPTTRTSCSRAIGRLMRTGMHAGDERTVAEPP